jgi:hypothetical protein
VGGVNRRRAKRALDHGGDLIIIDRARPARTGFVQKPFDAVLEKAPPPFADRMLVNAQLRRNHLAGNAFGASEDDPAALRHRSRHTMAPDLSFEVGLFPCAQRQRRNRTSC